MSRNKEGVPVIRNPGRATSSSLSFTFYVGIGLRFEGRKLVSRINLVVMVSTSELSCPIKEFCPGSSHDEPDSSTRNVRGRGNNNAHKITNRSYCFHKAIT
eukprot:scaffold8456_cov103-Skeletonema_dohrnii-CCMP3373.AAC.5